MGEGTIEGVLSSFGLTEREVEMYLFLAKHEVLKCGEIAKGLKKHTAQIYRVLKILQSKGLVESTLESPTRFAAVSIETIIDQRIKAKHDEAALIEKTRNEVLTYWKNIRIQPVIEPSLEKFLVVEGNHKIYAKISQMVKETKNQLSAVTTAAGLSRAEQFGVFQAVSEHPLKSKIQFRFLTELSSQNAKAVKALLKRATKANVNFKGRNPNLELKVSTQMVIRDEDEILVFITPSYASPANGKDDVCLWTNCKTLVQSFLAVFEDLWHNSKEIETDRTMRKKQSVMDAETAKKKYERTVNSAKKEILMLTSPEGLTEFWGQKPLAFEECAARGVSIKIMAPVVKENLEAAKQLSKFCMVRHVPINYLPTTIIDAEKLFQFRASQDQENPDPTQCFGEILYSVDRLHVEMIKTALNDLWETSQAPSTVTLESIVGPNGPAVFPIPANDQLNKFHGNITVVDVKPPGAITEKDLLNKIINAQRIITKNPAKDVSRRYASMGLAVIHPPDRFNLPDMMIEAVHVDKQSSFGPGDYMVVFLWLETPKGHAYVPVAVAGEPLNAYELIRRTYEGSPAGKNIQRVEKNEIEISVHGNTLFAGWTVPIQLCPSKYILPPACILIEGYGSVKTRAYTILAPSGFRHMVETNYFDAFVTFIHPSSKYSGPGTDGILYRDHIATNYPPH